MKQPKKRTDGTESRASFDRLGDEVKILFVIASDYGSVWQDGVKDTWRAVTGLTETEFFTALSDLRAWLLRDK